MRDINLLPEDLTKSQIDVPIQKQKVKISVKPVLITILVIFVMAATIVLPRYYMKVLDMKVTNIKDQLVLPKYNQIRDVNSRLASISGTLAAKAEVISFIDKQSYSVNEMLECVKHVAPSGTTISSFDYNSSKVKITLKIKEYSQVAEFLLSIDRLGFLVPDDSMKEVSLIKDGVMNFSFKVASKGGK